VAMRVSVGRVSGVKYNAQFEFSLTCSLCFSNRAELGRASWKLLHTMMARYPDEPSEEQQESLRSFIYLFARLYPWYVSFYFSNLFFSSLLQSPPTSFLAVFVIFF
jgi:hypothetical protein